METIVALVPPVLASVAGIFPILLESLPASFDTKCKPLAIILLISSIWVVHILILSVGYSYTLFSPTVTVIPLVVGVSMLAILLGMSLGQIQMAKTWASALYISSIICLVAGFSNHLLMKDHTVLRFAAGKDCPSIVQLGWNDADNTKFRLDYVDSVFGIGAVWPNERFKEIADLSIYCRDSTIPNEIPKEQGVYRPWGAGESYEFKK